jgi:hypothetical protein
MRQVFSSQRLETVEGVAKLLADAGIEVHVSNARSYRSRRGGQFSYSEPMSVSQQAAVWIRHAEDQPRARELLRQAGLLETTRPGGRPSLNFAEAIEETPRRAGWAWRIRLVLLAVIALAVVITVMRHRQAKTALPAEPSPQAQPAAPPAKPAAPAPEPAPADEQEEPVRVRIQPSSG